MQGTPGKGPDHQLLPVEGTQLADAAGVGREPAVGMAAMGRGRVVAADPGASRELLAGAGREQLGEGRWEQLRSWSLKNQIILPQRHVATLLAS